MFKPGADDCLLVLADGGRRGELGEVVAGGRGVGNDLVRGCRRGSGRHRDAAHRLGERPERLRDRRVLRGHAGEGAVAGRRLRLERCQRGTQRRVRAFDLDRGGGVAHLRLPGRIGRTAYHAEDDSGDDEQRAQGEEHANQRLGPAREHEPPGLRVAQGPARRSPVARLRIGRLAITRLAAGRLAITRLGKTRLAACGLAITRLAACGLAITRLAACGLGKTRLAARRLTKPRLAITRLAITRLAARRLAITRLAARRLTKPRLAITRLAGTRAEPGA